MPRTPRRTALIEEPIPALDVFLGVARLNSELDNRNNQFFRTWNLTNVQYGVLRQLYVRDPDGAGIPSGQIGARLLTRVPDVTRLIDRLVGRELVERVRNAADRRVVCVRLTASGRDLVEELHEPLIESHRALLAHMTDAELGQLDRLLTKALARPDASAGADDDNND